MCHEDEQADFRSSDLLQSDMVRSCKPWLAVCSHWIQKFFQKIASLSLYPSAHLHGYTASPPERAGASSWVSLPSTESFSNDSPDHKQETMKQKSKNFLE